MPVSHSPPVLVGVDQPGFLHGGDQNRARRRGHIPDLVAAAAHCAQQVDVAVDASGQIAAFARAHHLGFAVSFPTRDVEQILRIFGIGDIHDRGAVALFGAGERILVAAGVVADIGDPAIALLLNDRLVGATSLQVVVAHEPHVQRFFAFGGVLCVRAATHREQQGSESSGNSGSTKYGWAHELPRCWIKWRSRMSNRTPAVSSAGDLCGPALSSARDGICHSWPRTVI